MVSKGVLGLVGGALSFMLMPTRTAAWWVAGSLAIEIWVWLASRPARRPSLLGRLHFAVAFTINNLWWVLLGGLLWATGETPARTIAIVTGVSVLALGLALAEAGALSFLVVGAVPPAAGLLYLALEAGWGPMAIVPLLGALALIIVFAGVRAWETPSARAAQMRLEESLEQYRILADNATDVIARTDMSGRHLYLSPSTLPVLGYSPDELVGADVRALVEAESLPAVDAAVSAMNADPLRPQVFTVRFRHKDGRRLWLQVNAKLYFRDGQPTGVVHVSRDITEQVETAQALEVARAEAEAASRAKAEFLANVSHEIRTPMNGVLGALNLLDREPVSETGRELLRRADDCGRMLSQLLNDVLDFSKIEAGQLELAVEPMNPADALRSVTDLLEPQARAKGVALRVEIEGGEAWIESDPLRLRQAMFNLVGNAIKFTESGEVAVRLTVEPYGETRRHLRLDVRDTGVGIAEDAQAALFERFRQADSSTARRFGGAGLGLSITRALVEMMGGQIGVRSKLGVGSTFWLAFDAPASAAAEEAGEDELILDGVNILLVEDNATNRLVARTLLGRMGASVEEAEDGLEGVQAAKRGGFDLILMDVQMPHMDGVEATRVIRGLPAPVGETPILGLTANVMTHQRQAYLAAGMNGVVAKPISPAALLGEIARLAGDETTAQAV